MEITRKDVYNKFTNMSYDERVDYFLKYIVDTKYEDSTTEEHTLMVKFVKGITPSDRIAKSFTADNEKVRLQRVIDDVFAIMVYHNLCIFNDTLGGVKNYRITEKGIVINIEGGWLKHKTEKERKRNLEIENIEASIKTAELVEKNMSFQKRTTWIAIGVAIVSLIVAFNQYNISKETFQLERIKKQQTLQHTHKCIHDNNYHHFRPKSSGDTTKAK